MNTPTPTPRTDAASALTSQHRHDDSFGDPEFGWVTVGFARTLERELAALRADKIRLDALDAILAENAYRARLGWRWNPEGPDSEFKLHLSQDGKMRSIRQALDVMLAFRKEGAK